MVRPGVPAPLLSIPEAPPPAGMEARFLAARDGLRLRAAVVHPDGAPRGSVILSPGRTEPIEKYYETIGDFLGRGFSVLTHDWRGQGLSARLRKDALAGHASGWRTFLADFDLLLSAFERELPKPWILVGHSMGGGLTALKLARGEPRASGALLSAPMLGIQLGRRGPGAVRALTRFMIATGRGGRYAVEAADPLEESFEGNVLTHDEARWRRFRAQLTAQPELRLGGATFGWLSFAFALADQVRAAPSVARLPIPVSVVAAGEERLVRNEAARAFADRAPHGRYREAAGALHELLMETDPVRAIVFEEFDRIADEIAPRPRTAAEAATRPEAPAKRPRTRKAPSRAAGAAHDPADAPKAERTARRSAGPSGGPTASDAAAPRARTRAGEATDAASSAGATAAPSPTRAARAAPKAAASKAGAARARRSKAAAAEDGSGGET